MLDKKIQLTINESTEQIKITQQTKLKVGFYSSRHDESLDHLGKFPDLESGMLKLSMNCHNF